MGAADLPEQRFCFDRAFASDPDPLAV